MAGYWADIANVSMDFGWNLFSALRDWDRYNQQKEREDTAVQRRMADLKMAGINPLLAGGQAAGATPVSAQAFSSTGGMKQNYAQLALFKSQIAKNKADARASNAAERKQLSEAALSDTMQGKVKAEEDLLKGQTSMIEVEKDYRFQQKKLIDSKLLLDKSQLATDAVTRQKLYKEIGKINAEWENLIHDYMRKGVEFDRMLKVEEFIKKYPKLGTMYLMLGPTGSGMAIHGTMRSGGDIIKTILDHLPPDLLKKKNPIGFGKR